LGEVSPGGIDTEDDDGIGVLVFCEDEPAGGVESKVARFFAAGRENTNRGQCTVEIVYAGDSDAVVAAVGGIEASA
jgi:hypothetical protein